MFFRNLTVFRLRSVGWLTTLESSLAKGMFKPCGPGDLRTQGWTIPYRDNERLVYNIGANYTMTLLAEEKILPPSVVRQRADIRAAEIAAQQGYKPGRKQYREIREEIEHDLLAKALTKFRSTRIWIAPINDLMVIDSASSSRCDEVIERLKSDLGELPLALVRTKRSPGNAMTQWVHDGEAPEGFSIDRDCEMRQPVEEHAAVKYSRHNLDSDNVRQHIADGKAVSRLGLTWRDRVSFVLTDAMTIKRVQVLDLIQEQAERDAENGADIFASQFTLMAGEYGQMLQELIAALGGHAE